MGQNEKEKPCPSIHTIGKKPVCCMLFCMSLFLFHVILDFVPVPHTSGIKFTDIFIPCSRCALKTLVWLWEIKIFNLDMHNLKVYHLPALPGLPMRHFVALLLPIF